jgi:hypothetical protein
VQVVQMKVNMEPELAAANGTICWVFGSTPRTPLGAGRKQRGAHENLRVSAGGFTSS